MKLRAGFVSNSSSSSFVLLGVKLTDKQTEKLEERIDAEDLDYDAVEKGILFASEESLLGACIDISDDDYDISSKSASEFDPEVVRKRIEKVLGKPVKKLKLFYGRRSG